MSTDAQDAQTATIDEDVREQAKTARYPQTKPGKTPRRFHGKVKRTYKPARPYAKVTGITLHQVAVNNVGLGAYKRMTAHLAVHHDGTVYWIHPLDTFLLHGNGFNRDTIGIEVAGRFDRHTLLPAAQVEGLHRAIRFAIEETARNGGTIASIWAHRQSSKDRAGDPHRAIYQNGVMWAQQELGLKHDPELTRGSGRPIPDAWMRGFADGGDEALESVAPDEADALEMVDELDAAFEDEEDEEDDPPELA